MTIFERKLPNEEADAATIIRGILKVQAAFAAAQKRPLGRGTHTKGICARATFEVFDLAHKTGDGELAARLAKGIYAKPGIYPTTVRFANAASTIYSDKKPDLRALSFSVELPPGMGTAYQDYSMQTACCFPINDAHAFGVAMSVLSAGSGANKLKAIRSLSFRDALGFLGTGLTGALQEHAKTKAYQQNRYWSTVPFRNGPFDAVMYSAIPREGNPAQPLSGSENDLQDELIRHLNDDERMSSWDIALQLLDAERMTRWGMRRDPSFWIENASVAWKESQAPFHVVGRLTLLPKSALPLEECVPRFIDVTEHATPDSQPLGSVNRARRAAELASRKVRLGQATAEEVMDELPITAPAPRSWPATLGKAAIKGLVMLIVGYFLAGFLYHRLAAGNVPKLEPVADVRYLDQGWGVERESPDRELYYYTPQGTTVHGLRYSWFVNLERPFSKTRIADPDHMRELNFIVDTVATDANPQHLPIGFARRYDDGVHDDLLDVTCAACHNGQLNYTKDGVTKAIRIDGGPALNAFTDVTAGSFSVEVMLATAETLLNPLKFYRFAAKVLGPDANTLAGKASLWWNLRGLAVELAKVGAGSSAPWHYPVREGYGRTDALARIGNVVFGDHISSDNYAIGNGPVSFPYLWNIWKFDWVQYNASVSQPMARNVGEAMGVGARYQFLDDYGRPLPKADRYRTTVSFENLVRLESTLQRLSPPHWPEDILGPIDTGAAGRGQKLFQTHCEHCHGPHLASPALQHATSPGRTAADPMWKINWLDVKEVGTDPTTAENFVHNHVDLTRIGLTFDEVKPLLKKEYDLAKSRQDELLSVLPQQIALNKAPGGNAVLLKELTDELDEAQKHRLTDASIAQVLDSIDFRQVNVGTGLNLLGMVIRERYYEDQHFSDEARSCFEGFGTLDLPQVEPGYKPRPLEGVWATPPFLHNGSVPNLYELLSPVEERSPKFFVGRREFDPVKVGYVTKPAEGSSSGFWLDTKEVGNRNTGHEFGKGYKKFDPTKPASEQYSPGIIGPELSKQERMDLIEYLKVHKDSNGLEDRKPADCLALLK